MRKEKISKFIKKFFIVLGILLVLLCVWQYKLLFYGIAQAKGQISIIWNARPIAEVLVDTAYPDSIKTKIRLVQEIRKFAFDSLGLNKSDNYTTFYDQKGKPVLWIVTGAAPYKLEAKEWDFPFLGSVTYKGFFEYPLAKKEAAGLKAVGLDVSIDAVEGWSTLGWFKDPILSNMLDRSVGALANVIIHELTHGTLYIKDNVKYNENLASFVGEKGALMFLEQKYGKDSEEYQEYVKKKQVWKAYSKFVLDEANCLDSLYLSFDRQKLSSSKKALKKEKFMKGIVTHLKSFLSSLEKDNSKDYNTLDAINNTYFIDFRRYREDQDVFEKELNSKFHGNFKAYFKYLKKKYSML